MIAIATTIISIQREAPADDEKWETELSTVASGIRAHIDSGSVGGRGTLVMTSGGETASAYFRCLADPCDLRAGDQVTDHEGITYQVEAAQIQRGPLEHMLANLSRVAQS